MTHLWLLLLYADDVFWCHLSGIVVIKVAMDMVVFVQYGLHLLDVVYGVEYDIVGRETDADVEAIPLQQGEIGKIIHEPLKYTAGFQPAVRSSGYS